MSNKKIDVHSWFGWSNNVQTSKMKTKEEDFARSSNISECYLESNSKLINSQTT
jgi:hypothetical protein